MLALTRFLSEQGLGADNAPAAKPQKAPGQEPVASDSGISSVGIETGTNQPGEKGNLGPQMSSGPTDQK